MAESTRSDVEEREQKQMALLHLQRLHGKVFDARPKGIPWAGPLLRGFLAAVLVLFAIGAVVVLIEGPERSRSPGRDPSPLLGLLWISVVAATWTLVTRYYRRRIKAKCADLVGHARQELEAFAGELSQRMPEWTESIGGIEVLLDAARVGDALAALHRDSPSWQRGTGNGEQQGRPTWGTEAEGRTPQAEAREWQENEATVTLLTLLEKHAPGEIPKTIGAAYWTALGTDTGRRMAALALDVLVGGGDLVRGAHRAGIIAATGRELFVVDLGTIIGENLTAHSLLKLKRAPKVARAPLSSLSANCDALAGVLVVAGDIGVKATFPCTFSPDNPRKAALIARAIQSAR